MEDKMKVTVAVAIFLKDAEDKVAPRKCAFYDKDGLLYLPSGPLTPQRHAAEIAVELAHTLVPVNPRLLTIAPLGFFDPLIMDEQKRINREILLAYRVYIAPGMPVNTELVWKNYEELGIAADRISQGHFRVYRAG